MELNFNEEANFKVGDLIYIHDVTKPPPSRFRKLIRKLINKWSVFGKFRFMRKLTEAYTVTFVANENILRVRNLKSWVGRE